MATGQQFIQASADTQAMTVALSSLHAMVQDSGDMNGTIQTIISDKLADAIEQLTSVSGWFMTVAGGRDGVQTCDDCGHAFDGENYGATIGATLCGMCADTRRESQWEAIDDSVE